VVVKRPDGLRIPIFLDFSLKYMIQGEAMMLGTMENITKSRLIDLNRVDFSTIPLEDALVVGTANAKYKIVVFDDPMCSFCQKLQEEMKAVVKKRPDIAFFIKMLPNEELHATSTERARTIICEKSLELLEKSLSGQQIGKPKCTTDIVEKNKALAESLRIKPTPTLVYPDGRVMPGYRTADEIIKALAEGSTLKPNKK
jgi:thiol:disulfide interchange protein DsbC